MKFLHLVQMLVNLIEPVHITPKFCRCSVNVVCQVFPSVSLGSLSSSGIHFEATFARLCLPVSAHDQRVSSAVFVAFRPEISFR